MTTMVRAQLEMHKAAEARVLAAYQNEKLFEDAKASVAEREQGGVPTPREELRRKY